MSIRINDINGLRTPEEHAKNVKVWTDRENLMKSVLIAQYKENGINISIEDYGVDNSGKQIKDGEIQSKDFSKPDWLLKFPTGNSYIVDAMVEDVKYSICGFKTTKLNSHLEKNASIFVFRNTYFDVYNTKAIEYILSFKEEEDIYKRQARGINLFNNEIEHLVSRNKIKRINYNKSAIAELDKVRDQVFPQTENKQLKETKSC